MRKLTFFITVYLFLNIRDDISVESTNVLFIIIDDLRPAIKSFGDGKAFTPNIDRLVNKSYYFTKAYSQQALCGPSRNSLLTSRRPDTLKLYDFYSYWRTFSGNFTTLPQYFKLNGYHTVSIGKVFHQGKSSNFTDDFPYSWSEVPYHPSTDKYTNKANCFDLKTGSFKKNLLCPVDVLEQPGKTLPDIQSVEKAKELLIKFKLENLKFFLAVGFHRPHIPFKIPFKYLKYHPVEKFISPNGSYKPYNLPSVAWNPFNDIRKRDDIRNWNITFPFGPIDENLRRQLRQHYYASVTYIDDLIGNLLESVDFNKTVIVLTSDHGWSLGEHAEWAKYSNFDVALRVPLIIYNPKIILKKKIKIENIVELIDVFPTIVDIAKLPKLSKCFKNEITCTEGKSLLPLMKNLKIKMKNVAYSQYPRPSIYPKELPNSDRPRLKDIKFMGYTIRTNQFRYTLWIKFDPVHFKKYWNQIVGEELYDHSFDAEENINLADRKPLNKIKKELKKMLKRKFR